MKLYNTLSKTIEEFVPNEPGKVKMYTCGPTVYHFAHIGNLRTYIMEDVLEKFLRYVGYDVTRVMNVTDVGHLTSDGDTGEDKMLKGAKREHKTVLEIAEFYRKAFFDDCAKLNIKTPDIVQPATGCIDEFIQIISYLLEHGFAYIAEGNVYFDTSKAKDYYALSGHNTEELMVGVRDDVSEDTNKRNKSDFVLWFTKSKFDIHCGGVDNIFPHHTNEIAQSEAYVGHKWCNYWFHVQHLNDETGKMSKSKGEFLTVSLLEARGYDPLAYRLFCLQSHYRKPLTFSFSNLDNAAAAYAKLTKRIAGLSAAGEVDAAALDSYRAKFIDAVGQDLNTAQGLTVLYDMLKDSAINDATKRAVAEDFDRVLSLGLIKEAVADEAASANGDDAWILARIAERAEAKKAKNYALADAIRAELLEKGIALVDTKDGTTYTKA